MTDRCLEVLVDSYGRDYFVEVVSQLPWHLAPAFWNDCWKTVGGRDDCLRKVLEKEIDVVGPDELLFKGTEVDAYVVWFLTDLRCMRLQPYVFDIEPLVWIAESPDLFFQRNPDFRHLELSYHWDHRYEAPGYYRQMFKTLVETGFPKRLTFLVLECSSTIPVLEMMAQQCESFPVLERLKLWLPNNGYHPLQKLPSLFPNLLCLGIYNCHPVTRFVISACSEVETLEIFSEEPKKRFDVFLLSWTAMKKLKRIWIDVPLEEIDMWCLAECVDVSQLEIFEVQNKPFLEELYCKFTKVKSGRSSGADK